MNILFDKNLQWLHKISSSLSELRPNNRKIISAETKFTDEGT